MSDVITMTANIRITGSTGGDRNFIIQEQFEYTDTEYRKMVDGESIYISTYTTHYKIEIDDIIYYIPDYYCVVYDVPYESEYVTDKRQHEYLENSDDIKDVYKEYKEVLGRTIDNTYEVDVSFKYAEILRKSNPKKSQPGK